MPAPRYFSSSYDDTIYLADEEIGVYQSTDDGFSWDLVFQPTDGWHSIEVIKVASDQIDNF